MRESITPDDAVDMLITYQCLSIDIRGTSIHDSLSILHFDYTIGTTVTYAWLGHSFVGLLEERKRRDAQGLRLIDRRGIG